MSDSDRHINFKLMRDHILSLQDGEQKTPRTGKKYWRSLEELADTPQFREFVAREFPQQAEGWNDPVERRTFIKLMGASLALAGMTGCVFQPPEKIVPYVTNRKAMFRANRYFSRPPLHFSEPPRRSWCAATKAGRRKSKAIPIIRITSRLIFPRTIRIAIREDRARPISSRKPRY